jgi:hypothetical protein
MKKYKITIENEDGKIREISLDHEYENMRQAESEAEDIADQEYTETDIAWALFEVT